MNHLKPANLEAARGPRSNHRRIEDLIAASVDFDLTPDERAEIEEHLISCPACQAVSAGYWRDADALRTLAFGLKLGPARG